MRCAGCGEDNPARARFCLSCGSPLATTPAVERRKLATLLFCDVVGSTELGEARDPEAVRGLMTSYFELCRERIERRGGTVEKFIGDAVMAVFGVPVAHEDDPVRAVSAAVGIRSGVGALTEESVRRLGRPLQVRIGVATGEVVAGDDASRMTMVTGDAVNTAARLEAAAAPGEILVDGLTAELVAGAVVCEPVGSIAVKGKSEPVESHRVQGAGAAVPHRAEPVARATSLVGRREEQRRLHAAWERARDTGTGVAITVVGEAGVGKSRLVRESLVAMAPGRVLRAVCPPYGEGMSYYPLRELLESAGVDLTSFEAFSPAVTEVVAEDGAGVAQALARAVGLLEGVSTAADIAWAARRWLGALSRRTPVVAVVDDVQWAQPAMRELLRSVTARQQGPVLLVGLARPELLEECPDWPSVLRLEPLAADEAVAVAEDVLGGALAPPLRDFVVARAGGNPLFAQELAEHLRSHGLIRLAPDGSGRWEPGRALGDAGVPTSLSGLLAARLDRTPRPLRTVMECGAIEGEAFHHGAVGRLVTDGEPVPPRLVELRQQGLVVPDRPTFPDEEAFRFHHLLLRDATYRSLPKARRAELHATFADWVEERATGRLTEFEEVVAYHLEQALAYRREVRGPRPEDGRDEMRLGSMQRRAGKRAAARGDADAAVSLLTRAAGHLAASPDDQAMARLDLAQVLAGIGAIDRCDEVMSSLRAIQGLEDARIACRIRIQDARLAFSHAPSHAGELAAAVVAEVVSDGTALDPATAALLSMLRSDLACWSGDLAEGHRRAREAVTHARQAGDEPLLARALDLTLGSFAVSTSYLEQQAVEALDWARPRGLRHLEGSSRLLLANVAAATGHYDLAWARYREAEVVLREVSADFLLYSTACYGYLAELSGDLATAEMGYREAVEGLAELGEWGTHPTMLAMLGRVLFQLGRLAEAEECARTSEAEGADDDVMNVAEWMTLRALVLSARGQSQEARAFAEGALSLSTWDDGLTGIRLRWLGEVYLALGDAARAEELACRSVEMLDRVEMTAPAAAGRALVDRCRAGRRSGGVPDGG